MDELMQIQSLELARHRYALAKCYLALLPRSGHAYSHFGWDMSFLLLGQGSWSRNKVCGPSLWLRSLGGSWSFLAPRIKEDTRCRHPRQRPKRRNSRGRGRLRTAQWNCKAQVPREVFVAVYPHGKKQTHCSLIFLGRVRGAGWLPARLLGPRCAPTSASLRWALPTMPHTHTHKPMPFLEKGNSRSPHHPVQITSNPCSISAAQPHLPWPCPTWQREIPFIVQQHTLPFGSRILPFTLASAGRWD